MGSLIANSVINIIFNFLYFLFKPNMELLLGSFNVRSVLWVRNILQNKYHKIIRFVLRLTNFFHIPRVGRFLHDFAQIKFSRAIHETGHAGAAHVGGVRRGVDTHDRHFRRGRHLLQEERHREAQAIAERPK